jgi:hypothetical protein
VDVCRRRGASLRVVTGGGLAVVVVVVSGPMEVELPEGEVDREVCGACTARRASSRSGNGDRNVL